MKTNKNIQKLKGTQSFAEVFSNFNLEESDNESPEKGSIP